MSAPGTASASLASDTSGTQGNASVLGGNGDTLNVGLHEILGGDSNAAATLPGTGASGTDGTIGDIGDTTNGITDNGGTVDTLLSGVGGDGSGLGGGTGGLPGGDNSAGGVGIGGSGGGGGGGLVGIFGASAGGIGANCIGPQGRQVLNFAARQGYSQHTVSSWAHASGIQLIPVKVCPAGRQALSRAITQNGNIQGLQMAAAGDSLINASLSHAHSSPSRVLAVTQQGSALQIYVY